MKRLLIASLLLAALTGRAVALDVMEAAERDLWCGTAIDLVVSERPSDSAIDAETLAWLTGGAESLLERGAARYREAGHSDRALAERRDALATLVGTQLGTPQKDEPFSYEECRALID